MWVKISNLLLQNSYKMPTIMLKRLNKVRSYYTECLYTVGKIAEKEV